MIINNFKNVEKLIILYVGPYSKVGGRYSNFKANTVRGVERLYKYKTSFKDVDYDSRGIEIVNTENEFPDFEVIMERIEKYNFLERGNVLIINKNLRTFFDLRTEIDKVNLVKTFQELGYDRMLIPDGLINSFFELCLFNVRDHKLRLKHILNTEEFKTTNGCKRICVDLNKIFDLLNNCVRYLDIDTSMIGDVKIPKRVNLRLKCIIKNTSNIMNMIKGE